MKQRLVSLCCVLLMLGMSGCGKQETPMEGGDQAAYKLGLSSVNTTAMDGTELSRIKCTVAAVILDADDRIVDCELDEVDFTVALKDGLPVPVKELFSKKEKGDNYHPTEDDLGTAGGSTEPWHEQAEKFCDYVEGKTGAQVSAIAATDGKTEQIPGCDLIVTDFITAVKQAADNATTYPIGREDDLALAVTALHNTSTNEQNASYSLNMAAVSLDDQDRITGCITDVLDISLTAEDGMFITPSGMMKTKRQMGDGYGMKTASPIGREWYQQADAFGTYARGKTADTLAQLPLTDGKTDAISGCTIAVDEMLKNAVKAARKD